MGSPPLSLYQYAEKLEVDGRDAGNRSILGKSFRPHENIWRYVGKPSEPSQFYEMKDKDIARFFKSLFLDIQVHSPVDVHLTGWDLHHGHLIITGLSREGRNPSLAILFHAKEYPREYPHFGKHGDPREGSPLSIEDDNYHLRNYLWTLGELDVRLLDPLSPDFPKGWIADWKSPFYTVDEFAVGSQYLGTIYFFPSVVPEIADGRPRTTLFFEPAQEDL